MSSLQLFCIGFIIGLLAIIPGAFDHNDRKWRDRVSKRRVLWILMLVVTSIFWILAVVVWT